MLYTFLVLQDGLMSSFYAIDDDGCSVSVR